MQAASADTYSASGSVVSAQSYYPSYNAQQTADVLVLQDTLAAQAENANQNDSVDVGFDDLYKGLSITAKQIVDKLNELLKGSLPDGLQSLKPEEVTPEATADRVVTGITSLFTAFAKQNPDLTAEELVEQFINQAKSGVEQGYGEAKQILGDLGAFEFDGVEDGIAETKELILTKLDKFAEQKLEELTGKATTKEVADTVKDQILKQGGSTVLDLVA